jgi:hypothetical protein
VRFGSSPSCEKELPRRSRVFTQIDDQHEQVPILPTPAGSVDLWNHLANNFHLEFYHLNYLYNLSYLNMQNNLDNQYMLTLHNLLVFLRLNNNDDDMNSKKLWCCQALL